MNLGRELLKDVQRVYRKATLKWGGAAHVDQRKLARFAMEHACPAAHASGGSGGSATTGANSGAPRTEGLSIGIVMPCYGHARYLPAAFESMVRQTTPPAHVVLVDDCSPDETAAVLRRLIANAADSQTRFQVVRNAHNLGQCASLNAGIGVLTTRLAIVLNDDDYLMHDALECIASVCRAHPDVRLIGARAVYVYGEEYLANQRKEVGASLISEQLLVRVSEPAQVRTFRSGHEIDMCHSGMAVYREAWRAAGGYRLGWGKRVIGFADRDFQIRVNALFPIAIVENAAFAFWRIDSSVDQGLFS